MPIDLFGSSRRSIERARMHISDLKNEIDAYNTSSPYEISKKGYGDKSQFVVKAHFTNEPPLILESIATDAIYNLRASLDQAIYAVAGHSNDIHDSDVKLKKIKFPIFNSQKKFETEIKKISEGSELLKRVCEKIIEYKPYLDENEDQSLIFALHEASNVNKHRHLTRASIRPGNLEYNHVSGPKTLLGLPNLKHLNIGGGGNTVKMVPKDAPVGPSEIGLYVSKYKPLTVYEVTISADIKFNDIQGLLGRSCTYQLTEIAHICENIVSDFEKICT